MNGDGTPQNQRPGANPPSGAPDMSWPQPPPGIRTGYPPPPPWGATPPTVPTYQPPATPQAPDQQGRSRRRLVAVLVVLAVLATGFAAFTFLGPNGNDDDRTVGPNQTSTTAPAPTAWDPRVEPIAKWTADARELDWEHPVEVRFLSEADYTKESQSEDESEAAEEADDMATTAATLRALGLIHGDPDLDAAGKELADSGTLAFYRPDTKVVYVRGTDLTPRLRTTLVHELVHALQDQHFDLGRIEEMDSSEAAVLRALAEGDAGRIEDIYADEELTEAERDEYDDAVADDQEQADELFTGDLPTALVLSFVAPYAFGPALVDQLDQDGGQAAIDEALQEPPSELVLFDLTHLNESIDVPSAPAVSLPDGATETGEDDGPFGPISWYLMLAARLDLATAQHAATSVVTDQMSTYELDGRLCVDIAAVLLPDADHAAFVTALEDWVAAGPAEVASVTDGDTIEFTACDPGADNTAEVEMGIEVLTYPVTRSVLYTQFLDVGLDHDGAVCALDKVMNLFTPEELSDPDFSPSSEQQRDLQDAMTSCR